MHSIRSNSVAVGALFITATAGYMVGQAVYAPLLTATDLGTIAVEQRTRLLVGVFLELIGILAIPLIAAFAFSVLKRMDEGIALSYLALRTIEAVLLLVVVVNVLTMADASRGLQEAGPVPSAYWEDLLRSLQMTSEWPFLLSVAIVFPLGSMLFNAALFRGRLVPRAIAAWGFLGATLLISGSVLDMLGVFPNVSRLTLEVVLSAPIAVQEMVLAGWLITKGFDDSMIAST